MELNCKMYRIGSEYDERVLNIVFDKINELN